MPPDLGAVRADLSPHGPPPTVGAREPLEAAVHPRPRRARLLLVAANVLLPPRRRAAVARIARGVGGVGGGVGWHAVLLQSGLGGSHEARQLVAAALGSQHPLVPRKGLLPHLAAAPHVAVLDLGPVVADPGERGRVRWPVKVHVEGDDGH